MEGGKEGGKEEERREGRREGGREGGSVFHCLWASLGTRELYNYISCGHTIYG